MDLRHYFAKIREIEASIAEPHLFVMSLETQDGGRAGVITEVSRFVAAKLIAEGRAARASDEAKTSFLAKQQANREASQRADAARRLQVTVISEVERTGSSEVVNSGNQAVKK